MSIKIQIGGLNHHLGRVHGLAGDVYNPQDVSPIDKYFEFFQKSPESYIYAIDENGRLVGYIISLPVTSAYFDKTIQPDFREQGLDADQVRPYIQGGNDVYLFSIVIDQRIKDVSKRIAILSSLSKAYMNQLREFAKKGIFVNRASALALSASGQKICDGLDMIRLGSNDKGVVYLREKFFDIYMNEATKVDILKFFTEKRHKRLSLSAA